MTTGQSRRAFLTLAGAGGLAVCMPRLLDGQAATLNTLADRERAGGWRLLFDGRTTNGWRGYRRQTMPDGWQPVEGALTRVGQGGDIVTVDQFSDFELQLEWNIAPGGNSGVFFRATEEEDEVWKTAPEVQVLDNPAYKDLTPETSAGSNYGLHAPSKDVSKPAGQWNHLRLIVHGNHVEHWLNGVKIVEYEIGSADWEKRVQASKFNEYPRYGRARRGHIALQDHGDRVAYRNIKIQEA